MTGAWAFWSNVAFVTLSFLAGAVGVIALLFNVKLGNEKDEALERFKKESQISIASANARSAEASEKTAELNVRAEVLSTEVERQKERAARAELSLLKVRQQVAPRSLSVDQSKRLIDLLRGKPSGPVSVNCILGDVEAAGLADQVAAILQGAGWPVTRTNVAGMAAEGFGLVVHSAETAPQYAALLQQAFLSVGVSLPGVESADTPTGSVVIWVGSKPGSVAFPKGNGPVH